MGMRQVVLRFSCLLFALAVSTAGLPFMPQSSSAIAATRESDALVAAWLLPETIDQRSGQAVTWCVQAAFAVSNWSRTLTGTLNWGSNGASGYRATPRDRLRVNYSDGRSLDYIISDIQGYPNEGPDAFLKNDYKINCRVIEKAAATDLTVNVTQSGGATRTATTGSMMIGSTPYRMDAQISRTTYFDSSSGSAEYNNETVLQGSVRSSDFNLLMDETSSFVLMSYDGETASHLNRTSNSQWSVAGKNYGFVNASFHRSDKNGRPAHMDTEWGADGDIRRNNQRWGTLASQVNGRSFEVWGVFADGSLVLESIRIQ